MKLFSRLLLLFFIGIIPLSLFSQVKSIDSQVQGLIEKADSFNLRFPQEKIYLHLDRPSYWASDDIWFKAYLLNSPKTESNVYVELLNASGEILQKKMVWAENGLAYGDFNLPDTTSSGVYQIRAYTNWMRNFDDCIFFRKNLVIWNLNDKQITEEPTTLRKNDIDFRFFPEGGTFVANTPNRIAFKAVDANGRGLSVEGKIFDDKGNEVAELKSLHKGMGSFTIQPNADAKYVAKLVVEGNVNFEADLPAISSSGVAMAVQTTSKSRLTIQVAGIGLSSEDSTGMNYILVGQAKGKVIFSKKIRLENGIAIVRIEKEQLPSGILQLTLFDTNLLPLCERLVFIKRNDFIAVDIQPDKPIYSAREKVQLGVKAIGATGEPYFVNLSMSASNPDTYIQLDQYPNTILTHFLLTSDLKGNIEDPAYYFKDDSITTLLALDHLLLTQGWRQFEWKEVLAEKSPEISYPAENSITIKGSVRNFISDKLVSDAKVSMLFVKNKFGIYEQLADSLGNFNFSNIYFNDTVYISVQALTAKGKNNTWIDLDNRSFISPDANFLPSNYQNVKGKTFKTTTFLSEENSELIKRKWHLSDTILLGDINVRASRIAPGDGHTRLYNRADVVVDVAKMDGMIGTISELVVDGRIPGVYGRELGEILIRGNIAPPLFLLDGIPVDLDLLEAIPVSSFDKIEVLKFANMYGSKGNNGAILFFTKKGGPEVVTRDSKGMRSSMVVGYSVIRQFYSPQYSSTSVEKNDYRSTLYWNPILRTDSTGAATVSFYNSDQTGDVEVVVEGISSEGKLCRGVVKYKVAR